MINNLVLEVEKLEREIIATLDAMDLEKLVLDSISENYFTRKNNDEFEIDVYFPNELFSHSVKFNKLHSIKIVSFEIEFFLVHNSTQDELFLEVTTSKLEKFLVLLKLNHDFSVWDLGYTTV